MGKINCHAHTQISDGADDILDMAEEAKRLGHSALVVTDHDSWNYSTVQSVMDMVAMLKRREMLPLPVIVGAEIRTPFGEFLLFGKNVLKNWNSYKDRLHGIGEAFDLNFWVSAFERYVLHKITFNSWGGTMVATRSVPYPYAMIVCHPWFAKGRAEFFPHSIWDLCHGFEIQNGNSDLEATHWETIEYLRKAIPGGMELHNSDAHSKGELTQCHNETPHEITDEAQLVRWLRSGRKNWGVNNRPVFLDKIILEEHMRGIEFTQKMMKGLQPCPPEYMDVVNKNMEDLLG